MKDFIFSLWIFPRDNKKIELEKFFLTLITKMPKEKKPEKDPETKLIECKAAKKQLKYEVKRMQETIGHLQNSIYQIKVPKYMEPWLTWVRSIAPKNFPIKTFTQWVYSGVGVHGDIKIIKHLHSGTDGELAVDYTTNLLLGKLHYHSPSEEFKNPKGVKIHPFSVFPKRCKNDEQFFALFRDVIIEKRMINSKKKSDTWIPTKYQDWPEEKSLRKYFVIRGFVELAQHPKIHIGERKPISKTNWVYVFYKYEDL